MHDKKKDPNVVGIEDGFNPFQGLTSNDLENAMYALQMPKEKDAIPEVVNEMIRQMEWLAELEEKYTPTQLQASVFHAERQYFTKHPERLKKLQEMIEKQQR